MKKNLIIIAFLIILCSGCNASTKKHLTNDIKDSIQSEHFQLVDESLSTDSKGFFYTVRLLNYSSEEAIIDRLTIEFYDNTNQLIAIMIPFEKRKLNIGEIIPIFVRDDKLKNAVAVKHIIKE